MYAKLVGTFPFNSFLAGFFCCVGTFVLTLALRMKVLWAGLPAASLFCGTGLCAAAGSILWRALAVITSHKRCAAPCNAGQRCGRQRRCNRVWRLCTGHVHLVRSGVELHWLRGICLLAPLLLPADAPFPPLLLLQPCPSTDLV